MGALTIAVTGAAGYLGRAVVAEGLARGHRIRAIVRRPEDLPGADTVVTDLTTGADLTPVFAGCDAVIHCAARMFGTEAEMQRDTVGGTAALATALARRTRFVLVSSLAVCAAPEPGGRVTEDTPPEPQPHLRDAYTRAKLAQERIAQGLHLPVWIVRPGIVWGPGRTDNAHLGARLGPVRLRIGGAGELPLAHRDNVARALVLAAETPPPERTTLLHLVDDDRPTRAQWLAALGQASLPLHWRLPDMIAGLCTRLGARAPGLLRRPTLRARLMPATYGNERAKALLGWAPHVSLAAGLKGLT
jgi:nucleoside-diphosphate-sugar epimerase